MRVFSIIVNPYAAIISACFCLISCSEQPTAQQKQERCLRGVETYRNNVICGWAIDSGSRIINKIKEGDSISDAYLSCLHEREHHSTSRMLSISSAMWEFSLEYCTDKQKIKFKNIDSSFFWNYLQSGKCMRSEKDVYRRGKELKAFAMCRIYWDRRL